MRCTCSLPEDALYRATVTVTVTGVKMQARTPKREEGEARPLPTRDCLPYLAIIESRAAFNPNEVRNCKHARNICNRYLLTLERRPSDTRVQGTHQTMLVPWRRQIVPKTPRPCHASERRTNCSTCGHCSLREANIHTNLLRWYNVNDLNGEFFCQ